MATVKFGRVTVSANISNLKERLESSLSRARNKELHKLSSFLKELSANLIRFSPTSDNTKSSYSKNQYVNNTRMYFAGGKGGVPMQSLAASEFAGYGVIPSQIHGLSECLQALSSGQTPDSIGIVNDTESPSGYPYWYHVEEIGWSSFPTLISDDEDVVERYKPPYRPFKKAWNATKKRYGRFGMGSYSPKKYKYKESNK